MRVVKYVVLAVGVVSSLIAVEGSAASKKAVTVQSAPLATPPGIRMKAAVVETGIQAVGNKQPSHPQLFYADIANKALYTNDNDVAGKSTCVAECAALWPPALAPADAKPMGDWSIIKRDDTGAAQWAYRNKPLYTYTEDSKPDENATRGRRSILPGGDAGRVRGDGLDGVWHTAAVDPAAALMLPGGFSVTEVLMAPGQVLVDTRESTLYTFNGKPDDKTIGKDWVPVAAPLLATPVGDFTVIARADGIYQWALHGQPLYSYKHDWVLGDANGRSVDSRFKVASVLNYFMPPNVDIAQDQRRGGLLVTVDTRQTLYTRDRVYWDGEGGHNTRGVRSNPAAGEFIGATACQDECEKTWKPLLAPADAKPQGYWTVYTRADGSKQWGYQGFALYTNVSDKPGDINGHDTFEITVAATTQEPLPPNLGMYWRAIYP